MALWRPRAAAHARDWLAEQRVAGIRQHPGPSDRLPAGPERDGLCRGPECDNRIPLGGGPIRSIPALAADLVHLQASVIVSPGPSQTFAAKGATSTIPIVFALGIDPVQSGLVASLNRPGGNITGVVVLTTELTARRFDLLHEYLPTAARVVLLVNPTSPANDP